MKKIMRLPTNLLKIVLLVFHINSNVVHIDRLCAFLYHVFRGISVLIIDSTVGLTGMYHLNKEVPSVNSSNGIYIKKQI